MGSSWQTVWRWCTAALASVRRIGRDARVAADAESTFRAAQARGDRRSALAILDRLDAVDDARGAADTGDARGA